MQFKQQAHSKQLQCVFSEPNTGYLGGLCHFSSCPGVYTWFGLSKEGQKDAPKGHRKELKVPESYSWML